MKKLVFLIVLCVLFSLLISNSTLAENLNYISQNGYDARAVGMGGAYTAIADDGSAAFWNPAGITQMSCAFAAGIGNAENLNSLSKPDEFALHLGLTSPYVAANWYSYCRDENSHDYLNDVGQIVQYGYHDFVLTLATPIGKKISIGGNVKLTLPYDSKDSGDTKISFDTGLLLRPNGDDSFRAGFVIRNLYPIYFYNPDLQKHDTTYIISSSYKPYKSTLFAADLELTNNSQIRLGFEQTLLWNIIACRAGLMIKGFNLTNTKLCAGSGLKFGPFLIDAAVVGIEDIETAEAFLSMGLKF